MDTNAKSLWYIDVENGKKKMNEFIRDLENKAEKEIGSGYKNL